jgi:hypothetical protein
MDATVLMWAYSSVIENHLIFSLGKAFTKLGYQLMAKLQSLVAIIDETVEGRYLI